MCDAVASVAHQAGMSTAGRRTFLKTLAATAAAGGLLAAGCSRPGQAAAPAAPAGSPAARTRLVLLGTSGGPGLSDPNRYGISTAVVHGDRTYVVDLGAGANFRLVQSGLGGPGSASLANVAGIFFTHLHSDHITEWPAVYLTGQMNSFGRTLPAIKVFGPGDRGTLPRVFPASRPEPPLYNPERPTPGIVGMTEYLRKAFAADLNDCARDSHMPDPDTLFEVSDIDLDGVWAVTPEGVPPRLTAPIPVWEDGDVRITATLVDHHPTAPSFAYRFDTPDGSVVVSGDTGISENLIDLARDVDYLVHEVIDPVWVDRLVSALPPEQGGPLKEHLLTSHTTIEQVGRDVAERAGAKNLVLTHLVADGVLESRWREAQAGYSGTLVVGADLMQLPLGAA
ncbi:MBL fold metallo-hydrolase [Pseudonocardia sichuanensis]